MHERKTREIGDLIDLGRYPVEALDEPGIRTAVDGWRTTLDRTGLLMLPGFLRPEAVTAIAAEAARLVPGAHRQQRDDIAYGRYRHRLAEFPENHAVRRTSRFSMGLVAYDALPEDGPCKRLYHWDGLTRFVAALTESPTLYRTADRLLSCNISVLGDGDTHGWHYDGNDFVVTLLLQAPEEGGHFEFAPNIAGPDDENFEAVARVYDGDRSRIVRPDFAPGTLSLFRGRYSLHRVSEARGPRPRLLAVFSYHREPGMVFPEATQRNYLGRAAA